MRKLNFRQPYAELMFHGKIETRTWPALYRGPVLIIASKAPYSDKQIMSISGTAQHKRIRSIMNLVDMRGKYGVAIGVGDLVDCRFMELIDADACFVGYDFLITRYCHIFENMRRIKPFPVAGNLLKYPEATPEEMAQIEYI